MPNAIAPFLMLAGGLLAFLFSTRQLPLIWRALIWLVGAVLIGGAIFFTTLDPSRHGLVRAFADASAHVGSLRDSVLFRALGSNWRGVSDFIIPLLDLFLFIGVALGVISLIAFTPGEGVERVVRPAFLILFGAMVGTVVALAVTAIGFGGHVKPRAYVQLLTDPSDVYDGDTIRMGEELVRIWGLDAPELQQECRTAPACGKTAREHLVRMLQGQVVYCFVPEEMKRPEPPMESFGRPIMKCDVNEIDVARQMIRDGYGFRYRSSRDIDFGYGTEESEARAAQRGLHAACLLEPGAWRRSNNDERNLFVHSGAPPPGAETIGVCQAEPA